MRKKIKIIFYSLFFMTAAIFEVYTLLELRQDMVSLLCSSMVMLIASYLFLDMIIDCYREQRRLFIEMAEHKELHKDLQELIKYEKALLVINKKILDQKEDV
ncbi:hypothetical protein lbkm_3307 [Lachnospiraceae bacterium KM106-2]|nr:hypothetical protein lbkm_3307 [Lachnospiraceae bacterium KM106-2]